MATKKAATPAKGKTTAPPTSKSKAVSTTVKKTEVGEAEDLKAMMTQDSGKGVSTAAEDNIIPLIYILQAQSPQCLKQKPECIKPGIGKNATAVAGNVWPRGTKTLIDGEEDGLPVIPVAFSKWWTEWKPNRGGYAGRHAYDSLSETKGRPEGAELVEDPKKPGKFAWELPSGNNVVETREHAVLAKIDGTWQGCVVSMSGSNHTASRTWMGLMKNKKIPGTDKRAPSFAYVYCGRTIPKTNADGDWYGWQMEDGMGDGEETFILDIDGGTDLYKMARQLNDDFMSGKKVADVPDEPVDNTSDESDDEDGDI
jgi:hypothetical protein